MDAVLEGLRLSGRQRQPIVSLSGGEKNLVALARVLLAEPDILLLDEPANHLDFAGLEWLENFPQDCRQTVVLVSHNRYLLDRVVDAVLEIEQGRLTRYAGNYSWYRAEKAKNLLARQAAYRDQQQEIRRLEEMIARYERWASQTNDPRQARRARNKQALEEFAGTLLVISHDRYFLDRIVDRIVELEPPHLKEYPGNFSYFWEKKNRSALSPIRERPPKSPRREKPPSPPVPVDG